MTTTSNQNESMTDFGFVKTWNSPIGTITSQEKGTCIHVDIRGTQGTQIHTLAGVPSGLIVGEKVKFTAKHTNNTKKPYIAISITGKLRITMLNLACC